MILYLSNSFVLHQNHAYVGKYHFESAELEVEETLQFGLFEI